MPASSLPGEAGFLLLPLQHCPVLSRQRKQGEGEKKDLKKSLQVPVKLEGMFSETGEIQSLFTVCCGVRILFPPPSFFCLTSEGQKLGFPFTVEAQKTLQMSVCHTCTHKHTHRET